MNGTDAGISHEDFERVFGRPAVKRRKLYNGMIPCQAYFYGGGRGNMVPADAGIKRAPRKNPEKARKAIDGADGIC